ncbi:hypothetical protein CR513_09573, partial [Mucuna pruriens]
MQEGTNAVQNSEQLFRTILNMAYLRLAPLTVFFLATSCINVPNKADKCRSLFGSVFTVRFLTMRLDQIEAASFAKMVNKHPSLCQSHDECMKKGSGNFCARYPNSRMEYGWCVNSEALKGFLKMPTAITE